MDKKVLLKDFMTKRSQMKSKYFSNPHFSKRWFELTASALNYYNGSIEKGPSNLKGSIKLSDVTVVEKAEGLNKDHVLQVGYKSTGSDEFVTLYICCSNNAQQDEWMQALRQACLAAGCTFSSKFHEGVWQKKCYSCCDCDVRDGKGCKDRDASFAPNSLISYKWYYSDFSKLQAKELLLKDGREGCFIVRDSNKAGMLALSVLLRCHNKDDGGTEAKKVLNYHLRNDAEMKYYLSKAHAFGSVPELIEYHQCNGSGLPTRLKCYPRDSEDFSDLVSEVIKEKDLHFQKEIGHGQFGVVSKAIYKNKEVAVKQIRDDGRLVDCQEFMEEAKFMIFFDHPNLVRLLGICLTNPIKIVTEYMKHGALIQYLKKHKDLKLEAKKGICLQVCSGMKYLEGKKIIHRDLAARNCLVGENLSIKICDFGLSRKVIDDEYHSCAEFYFSIRWSSPESLKSQKFSSKSDVWSFGILMWEVFTCGQIPYGDVTDNREVRDVICSNKKLNQPDDCPDAVYTIMQRCWKNDPDHRPSFDELIDNFETQIYVDLDE